MACRPSGSRRKPCHVASGFYNRRCPRHCPFAHDSVVADVLHSPQRNRPGSGCSPGPSFTFACPIMPRSFWRTPANLPDGLTSLSRPSRRTASAFPLPWLFWRPTASRPGRAGLCWWSERWSPCRFASRWPSYSGLYNGQSYPAQTGWATLKSRRQTPRRRAHATRRESASHGKVQILSGRRRLPAPRP